MLVDEMISESVSFMQGALLVSVRLLDLWQTRNVSLEAIRRSGVLFSE